MELKREKKKQQQQGLCMWTMGLWNQALYNAKEQYEEKNKSESAECSENI